jgi:RNA polymerase sigma factor (sigma-70 family)
MGATLTNAGRHEAEVARVCSAGGSATPGITCLPGKAVDPGLDFAACYRQHLPGLVWFVMSLGASADEAQDAAQSAFAAAFPVWDTIRHPQAWLRRVAERVHCRSRSSREFPVEITSDRPWPPLVSSSVELRDEAAEVLAALAALPARQRQIMAWHVDGFSPAEIARELNMEQAAVRQNLAKARKNLKRLLGFTSERPL